MPGTLLNVSRAIKGTKFRGKQRSDEWRPGVKNATLNYSLLGMNQGAILTICSAATSKATSSLWSLGDMSSREFSEEEPSSVGTSRGPSARTGG